MKPYKIISEKEVESGGMRGRLIICDIEDYGQTEYWIPETYTEEAGRQRAERCLMPIQYSKRELDSFDWAAYGENVDFQRDAAWAFVLQFPDFLKQGRGLYIHSKVKGSGKTLLACCLANEVMKRNDVSVKFATTLDYIDLCRDKTDESKSRKEELQDCSLLILDDIGAENSVQDWIQGVLFHLIDYRDKNLLSTIYTANISPDKLHLDERIIDRIISHSIALKMPEISVRRRWAKQSNKDFLRRCLNDIKESGI